MNYDKLGIRDAYQKEKEKRQTSVNADELRALGYSEEEIQKAQLD
jgi:Holliday junction resolvasome RuvABC DNA-binding subunit